jgi:hypothetical protein
MVILILDVIFGFNYLLLAVVTLLLHRIVVHLRDIRVKGVLYLRLILLAEWISAYWSSTVWDLMNAVVEVRLEEIFVALLAPPVVFSVAPLVLSLVHFFLEH